MGESSTFVPSWSEVRTNTSDFRTNTSDFRIGPSDLRRYRPILRPISFVVRYDHSYHQFIHCNIISTSSGYEHRVTTTHHGAAFFSKQLRRLTPYHRLYQGVPHPY